MTLLVARQVNNEIYIVADTKFDDGGNSTRSESKKYIGGLKVVLLTPGLCVGFAGNTEIARNAIQGLYDSSVNLFDKNQAIEHFLKQHVLSVTLGRADETEFVVAVIVECHERPGTFLKEIFRIADSKVYWDNETTHIGDRNAFGCFQEAFHNGSTNLNAPTVEMVRIGSEERPGFDQSLSAAMRAMQNVIDSANIPCVDGIRTVVISEENQFRYLEYIQIRGNLIPVRNTPSSPVSFGGAAEGSDHKHVGMFSVVGYGIFSVYSITGCFGLIYHPEQCFEPEVCRNCTLEEFRFRVEEVISVVHQRALDYQAHF